MADLVELQRAGLIRRRLRGGYRVTLKGTRYLRDVCARNQEVRAKMSQQAEKWESGELPKSGRREALVDLVVLGWKNDRTDEAKALADLRSQGFDPISARVESGHARTVPPSVPPSNEETAD
jgi:hypothetical protein